MSGASVIFILCVIAGVAVVGVTAVAFERKRVRENASPDRIPARVRRRAQQQFRARHQKGE